VGQYQTFIVRIWTSVPEDSVRGHIQHIASQRGAYFRDSEKMLQFMREFVEPAALPVADGESGETPEALLQTELPGQTAGPSCDRGGSGDW
jgi:hypothetical protein